MHSMIYATVGSEEDAVKIAGHLLRERLVACANILRSRSLYRWKGRIRDEGEFVLVMKTRMELVERAMNAARAVHPYEVPCLVSYAVEKGLPGYLGWIDAETRTPKSRHALRHARRSSRSPRPPSSERRRPSSRT